MKKVLLVAYYFPPFGGGGVQRTAKYVKYLQAFGWEPVVVTIGEDLIPLRDDSLLQDIPPNVEIIRTKAWGLAVEKILKRKAVHVPSPGSQSAAAAGAAPASGEEAGVRGNLFTAAIRRLAKQLFLLAYTVLLYPDDRIGWYPFALRAARERLAQGDIDLIYTTSAPFTAHLVGRKLKKAAGLPWVADFRDPWAGNEYLNFRRLRAPADRWLEKHCVRQADKVITVSDPIRDAFRTAYPDQPPDKFRVIVNGYDEADFATDLTAGLKPAAEGRRPAQRCVICFTGSFYQGISPRFFLLAVGRLFADGRLDRKDILLKFTGQFGTESRELIRAFQEAHPGCLEAAGYVPHLEAVRAMQQADLLLLVLNKEAGPGVLTQKIFEYLGTGRTILALIPEGMAADLIREARAGTVVAPEDVPAIQDALLACVRAWQAGSLGPGNDRRVVARYSRRALTAKLAGVCNEVCPGSG